MGKIRDFIKNFIEPREPEKTFDELAFEAGIDENDLRALKLASEGINWNKFAREEEEETSIKKRTRAPKTNIDISRVENIQKEKTTRSEGIDR